MSAVHFAAVFAVKKRPESRLLSGGIDFLQLQALGSYVFEFASTRL